MPEKVPGYIGLCTQCRKFIKVALSDLDLKEGESLMGFICEDCSKNIEGSNGSEPICSE